MFCDAILPSNFFEFSWNIEGAIRQHNIQHKNLYLYFVFVVEILNVVIKQET